MSLILGDNLNELKKIESDSIDLIYLDPPFFTQKKQKLKNKENKEYSFDDSWESITEYTTFIKDRLFECKRVLKETGSIFLHCDKTASHYLRVCLDEVFGMNMFQSEIIWNYKRWSNSKKGLLNNHQNIYFYSKTGKFKFNTIYTDYSYTTNIDQILADRIKDENSKTKYKLDENGEPLIGKEKKGVPLSDVWNIPYLNPKAKERTGYPTQKPILLLEQIIKLTTEENDIILDPFCGSGTTLVASKILKRRYIGIDQSKDAIKLAEERLKNVVKTESNLLKKGESSYKTKTDLELNILQSLDATVVQRNKGIDGFLKNYHNGFPVPIKIQKENEDLYSSLNFLQSAMRRKKSNLAILVQTHENNLNLMFTDIPNNILLIQKYDLLVNQWLLNYK